MTTFDCIMQFCIRQLTKIFSASVSLVLNQKLMTHKPLCPRPIVRAWHSRRPQTTTASSTCSTTEEKNMTWYTNCQRWLHALIKRAFKSKYILYPSLFLQKMPAVSLTFFFVCFFVFRNLFLHSNQVNKAELSLKSLFMSVWKMIIKLCGQQWWMSGDSVKT